jgi:hypothetical protein
LKDQRRSLTEQTELGDGQFILATEDLASIVRNQVSEPAKKPPPV